MVKSNYRYTGKHLYNTNCLLFCTEKYKPEVDNADRACLRGLYIDRARACISSYLLTGRYIYKTMQFYTHFKY